MQTSIINSTTTTLSSSKRLLTNIKKVAVKAGSKIRSLFINNKSNRTVHKEDYELVEQSTASEVMAINNKCEEIVDTGLQAARDIYQCLKEDYFPVAVELYQTYIPSFIKPESIVIVEKAFAVVKAIAESERVKKSNSLLSLIKNVSIEAVQLAVNKLTSVQVDIEMVVDAFENGDWNKMADIVCDVMDKWEKTRVLSGLYRNMSVEYVIEFVGSWLISRYL